MSGYEPRFDIDLARGGRCEQLVDTFLDWVAAKKGTVEVKGKYILNEHLYVEMEHDPGARGVYKPSGLQVTTALLWVYVIDETHMHIAVPTAVLRRAVKHTGLARPIATKKDPKCPTRGFLVDYWQLQYRVRELSGLPEHPITKDDIPW